MINLARRVKLPAHNTASFIAKRTMATPSNVQLTVGQWPGYYRSGITSEASKSASNLLQENHDKHHIFFNKEGFHNHIAHHLLTLWALSAPPKALQSAYDANKSYQRSPVPLDKAVVADLHDPEKWKKYLQKEKAYPAFLNFFQAEMAESSWQDVLNKHVFARNEHADDMLVRLYAGFLHPIIHVGFGVEFHQPAIVAEGLAQTAVHDNWIGRLLLPTEKAVRRDQQSKSIVKILDEIRADPEVSKSAHWSDGNKIRDGVLARAGNRMVELAALFHVKPEELNEKTAEMTNAAAYYTAGAQREDRIVKYDFYFMHCVNSSIFFSAFQNADWLSLENKIRLLEWKVYLDLAMYASRAAPDIRLDLIRAYKPKQPGNWTGILDRAVALTHDDGHAAKLVRALAHGQRICAPYEDRESFRVKQEDWLQMGHMAIDSVEAAGPTWVRSAGFDEAWEEVPRAQL